VHSQIAIRHHEGMTSPIERRSSTVAAIPTSGRPDIPVSLPFLDSRAGRNSPAESVSRMRGHDEADTLSRGSYCTGSVAASGSGGGSRNGLGISGLP